MPSLKRDDNDDTVSKSNDNSPSSMMMVQTEEQAQAWGYPIDTSVLYNFQKTGEADCGVIVQVLQCKETRQLSFKVKGKYGTKEETTITEGDLAYGADTPVHVKELMGEGYVDGTILAANPTFDDSGGIDTMKYNVHISGTGEVRVGILAKNIKFRCTDAKQEISALHDVTQKVLAEVAAGSASGVAKSSSKKRKKESKAKGKGKGKVVGENDKNLGGTGNYATSADYKQYTAQKAKGLPAGWTSRKIPRSSGDKSDTLYFSPVMEYRFRTKPDAQKFLEHLTTASGNEVEAMKLVANGNKGKWKKKKTSSV